MSNSCWRSPEHQCRPLERTCGGRDTEAENSRWIWKVVRRPRARSNLSYQDGGGRFGEDGGQWLVPINCRWDECWWHMGNLKWNGQNIVSSQRPPRLNHRWLYQLPYPIPFPRWVLHNQMVETSENSFLNFIFNTHFFWKLLGNILLLAIKEL